ncbi:sulfurtransferase-like selenium metabolism protein YedF [Desulfovibrio sp. SGI.169]|uniref:sulfurtransferase-like selenium metabolism protein YedF n=1 Tax=Desulfovibrio sp. SGI.169 TaxID=3420561 RepID=UPI003D06F718
MALLDCRGLACPQPVMRCRDRLAEGATALEILVDNDAARENVARFLRGRGFEVTWLAEDGGLWRLAARADRPGDAAPSVKPAPEAAAAEHETRTLVLITTETLGRGDEELGGKLMGNFLATLPEMGARLWRLALLNGGVKLAARPGPALDALKNMAQNNVSVLVCGACLAHYGLLEAKAVGETSNMLDIVTSLDLADKIIRP